MSMSTGGFFFHLSNFSLADVLRSSQPEGEDGVFQETLALVSP